jgi:cyclopropane fatty-acyl-phospholipid synthase-like methyltransferase
MTWDDTWEEIYRQKGFAKYPSEEVIRFVLRNYGQIREREKVKLLDIGCGQGSNLWFMAKEGFDTYGIDASPSALHLATQYLASMNLTAELVADDFMNLDAHYQENSFDGAIDLSSIQHNKISDIHSIVQKVYTLLKPNALFFSTMVQAGTYGDERESKSSGNAYDNVKDGPLKGFGYVQLATLKDIHDIFSRFKILEIEESMRSLNDRKNWAKRWIIVCKKVEAQ